MLCNSFSCTGYPTGCSNSLACLACHHQLAQARALPALLLAYRCLCCCGGAGSTRCEHESCRKLEMSRRMPLTCWATAWSCARACALPSCSCDRDCNVAQQLCSAAAAAEPHRAENAAGWLLPCAVPILSGGSCRGSCRCELALDGCMGRSRRSVAGGPALHLHSGHSLSHAGPVGLASASPVVVAGTQGSCPVLSQSSTQEELPRFVSLTHWASCCCPPQLPALAVEPPASATPLLGLWVLPPWRCCWLDCTAAAGRRGVDASSSGTAGCWSGTGSPKSLEEARSSSSAVVGGWPRRWARRGSCERPTTAFLFPRPEGKYCSPTARRKAPTSVRCSPKGALAAAGGGESKPI